MAKKKPVAKAEGKREARPAPAPDPEARARTTLRPSFNAAVVVSAYVGGKDENFRALMDRLAEDVKDVWAGDMRQAEAMLYGQAHALQTIFVSLARRAALNIGEHMGATETYLRLALKAQGQCRATLETLAAIKNPPVLFARQANIAHGPQQVNNGTAPASEQPSIAPRSARGRWTTRCPGPRRA